MPRTSDPTICRDAAREAADKIRTLLNFLNTHDAASTILREANSVIEEKCKLEGTAETHATRIKDIQKLPCRKLN